MGVRKYKNWLKRFEHDHHGVRQMTTQAAIKLLKPPLQFGNKIQIEAVRQIERAHDCTEALRACIAAGHDQKKDCPDCSGTGTCSECRRDCAECDGIGKIGKPNCDCMSAYSADEISDAQDELDEPYTLGSLLPAIAEAAKRLRL